MEEFTTPERTAKHAAMPCWSGALVHARLKSSLRYMVRRLMVTEGQRPPVLRQSKNFPVQICQLDMKTNLILWLKRVCVIRALAEC